MDIDRAREIVVEYDNDKDKFVETIKHIGGFDTLNCLAAGIYLITKSYGGQHVDAAASHDVIYYGGFEESVAGMTEEEFRLMCYWGWIEYEDSWHKWV